MQQPHLKRLVVMAATVLLLTALTGTAAAVLTSDSGGATLRVDKRTENTPSATKSTAFVDLPGSEVRVSLNESRLIDAAFTAETLCTGPVGTWCSVRVVATNVATGGSVELNPVAGIDFAFDTAPANQDVFREREAHAMDRSRRLAPGNYRIRVQRAVSNAATTSTLDDWHFAVYQNV